jgi:hypothetical protein
MSTPSIPIGEVTRLIEILTRRWPGCTVGHHNGSVYCEVRTAEGDLIVAHEHLPGALRAAAAIAERGGL